MRICDLRALRSSTCLMGVIFAVPSFVAPQSAVAQTIGPGLVNTTQQVTSGSYVTVAPVDIVTNTGFGLWVTGTGQVDFQPGDVLVQTTGDGTGSHAMFADSDAVITSSGADLSILTSGASAAGLAAGGNARIDLSGARSVMIDTSGTYTPAGSGVVSAYGIVAAGNSQIIISNGDITTGGEGATGVFASGGSINLSNTSIHTTALTAAQNGTSRFGATGLRATQGGHVFLSTGSVITEGELAHGAVVASGGQINLSDVTIQTNGSGGVGANAGGVDSLIDMTNVDVTTIGGASDGLRAGLSSAGGTINMAGGSIAVSGISAYGAAAYGSGAEITLDGVTVDSTGSASNGLYAPGSRAGGVINAKNSTIRVSGSTGSGAFAQGSGSTINIDNTDIDTNKASGFGVRALGSSIVNVTNASSIVTRQANSSGVFADQSSAGTVRGSSIETLGRYSFGVYSQASSVIDVTDSSVTTRGDGGNGLYAVGTSVDTQITADNVTVETFGADAYAARLVFGSQITADNSSLITHGPDAHGVDFYAASGVTNTFGASNTQISSTGTSFNVWGGTANITLNNVHTTSDANQFLTVGIPPASTSLFPPADAEYTPPVNPASPAAPVHVDLNANASVFSGDSVVALGDSANITFGGKTTLTGAFTTLGNSDITLNDSRWNLTGTSNVTSLTNNNGLLAFSAPAGDSSLPASCKTMTVGDSYAGNGGAILFNTALGDDASPTDRLVVNGNTSGSSSVRVANIGGAGAPTVEGIRLIEVDGTSGGSFSLLGDYVAPDGEQAVVGGAYAYTLNKNGITDPTDGDWYLRSQLKTTPPDPGEPGEPGGPGEPESPPPPPRYQAGVPLYEQYEQVLQALNQVPTLRQRVGNRFWSGEGIIIEQGDGPGLQPDMAPSPLGVLIDGRGIWARIEGSHNRYEPAVSSSNSRRDVDLFKLQAGVDFDLHEAEDGSMLIGGITLQYGRASADIRNSLFGNGDIDTTAYGLGATLTWYGSNGFYVDGQAQFSWFDSDLTSTTAGLGLADGNNGTGYALSLETGKRFELDGSWTLTPQAQLVYSRTDFDSFTDRFGADISRRDGDSLTGRLGISIEREYAWIADNSTTSRSQFYGIANIYNEFLNGSSVDVSGIRFDTRDERLWGGVGVGGSYSWNDDKYSIYGEASINTSLRNFGDSYALNGTIGLRVKW